MSDPQVFIRKFGRKVGEKEVDIIQSLADDRSVTETAEMMGLTKNGVASRITKLRIAFKVHSVGSLIAIFFRNNLIE